MKKTQQHSKEITNRKLSTPDKVAWYDACGTIEDRNSLLTNLSISTEISEVALENQPFPESIVFSSCVMLRLPIRSDWANPQSLYATFLIFPNQLITLHEKEIPLLTQTRIQYQKDTFEEAQNIPSLISYILDNIVDTNIRCFSKARLTTEELGGKIDLPSVVVTGREVIHIRRQVSRLLSQFEDQFYALTNLQTQHNKKAFLSSLYDDLKANLEAQGHLVRSITHLEMRLRDIQQFYQYLMQRKTEQRLRQLTVLSVVYMPLTLLTGIYGMNFKNIPGLESTYGYFILLTIMVVITGVLIYFFYRKGWFQ